MSIKMFLNDIVMIIVTVIYNKYKYTDLYCFVLIEYYAVLHLYVANLTFLPILLKDTVFVHCLLLTLSLNRYHMFCTAIMCSIHIALNLCTVLCIK